MLTYHVVPGALTSSDIKKGIEAGGGSYSVKTVEGETLTLRQDNGQIFVSDKAGHTAAVTIADVMQSNGVIHGIDAVLMPM